MINDLDEYCIIILYCANNGVFLVTTLYCIRDKRKKPNKFAIFSRLQSVSVEFNQLFNFQPTNSSGVQKSDMTKTYIETTFTALNRKIHIILCLRVSKKS